jgi:ribosomal protein S18 acetylase RimI-like enzyme
MALRLRPIRDDELSDFVLKARDGYAQDIERNAGLSAAEARDKAERDIAALVPDGRVGEGQYLFVVEDDATGEAVGRVWFAERQRGTRTIAWLYEIAIDQEQRGRGLGRQAMLLLEDEVRRCGLPLIALNVFGGNERARSLYRSLGYVEDSVGMSKELDAG